MLIRSPQIYSNTDVLSPIDRETWQIIGETCKLTSSSRVLELASGKGAFARFLARQVGCHVDGFDLDPEFVEYSSLKAAEEGLQPHLTFRRCDINDLQVQKGVYDLGVCLGALYIFREAGWSILTEAVKPQGYLAISDIFCRKVPAPKAVMDVFFEEEGELLTLQDLRRFYNHRGFEILREVECSRKAWLDYYDLTSETLHALGEENASNKGLQAEINDETKEDRLIRKYGEEFVGYLTFILKRPLFRNEESPLRKTK